MEIFLCAALVLYVVYEVFIEVLLFQETCTAPKNSRLCACNFHSYFHPNMWVFINLPIYRKLIHGDISLVFLKPIIFCLALF